MASPTTSREKVLRIVNMVADEESLQSHAASSTGSARRFPQRDIPICLERNGLSNCGRCNSRMRIRSRSKWDEWKCETEGCTFEVPIRHDIIPRHELETEHSFPADGHSIPCDKFREPVVQTGRVYGYWRVFTFELFPGNFVTHCLANKVINRQPGGADDIFHALQGSEMGMQRFALDVSSLPINQASRNTRLNRLDVKSLQGWL